MAKKPNVPCAKCGTLLWGSPTSLPAGLRTCLPCRRLASTARPRRRTRVVCAGCDGEFIPYRKTDRFCSLKCRYRVKDRAKAHTSHRERARHFGVPYEATSAKRVYERDGWRCGLCREAVDPGCAFPDPLSPSLDHVIPLSVAGSPGHVWSNVQLAHLGCNIKKGAGEWPTSQMSPAPDAGSCSGGGRDRCPTGSGSVATAVGSR